MDSIYKRYVPSVAPETSTSESELAIVFVSNKILVKTSKEVPEIPFYHELLNKNIEVNEKQYLGEFDGHPCFCMEAKECSIPDGMDLCDMRSLLGNMDEDLFLLTGRAFQIMNWNRMNKFCGKCGTKTRTKEGERAKICPDCGSVFYPRISPAVIVAITREDKILLAHNKNFRQNWYSVIAGFVEPGETFEDCVKREVKEEVGIEVGNIRYFGSQPWPFPDSLMVGFTADWESGEIQADGIEINDAGWFDAGNLPQTPTEVSIAGRLIKWYLDKSI